LDQAFIESNSAQITEQNNACIEGASCLNAENFLVEDPFLGLVNTNNFLRIMAEDQATVDSTAEQTTLQDNTCQGFSAECANNAANIIDTSALDQTTVQIDANQAIEEANECGLSFCANDGSNLFNAFASGQSTLNGNADQRVEVGNECLSDAICAIAGANESLCQQRIKHLLKLMLFRTMIKKTHVTRFQFAEILHKIFWT
jgi:hypothetical protein